MFTKKQAKSLIVKHPAVAKEMGVKVPVIKAPSQYTGKGTRARLNTAAEKMFSSKFSE